MDMQSKTVFVCFDPFDPAFHETDADLHLLGSPALMADGTAELPQ
jgi:hypothetical protein